jgi:threonine synthase
MSFTDIVFEIALPSVTSDIPPEDLKLIIKDCYQFEIPLIHLEKNLYSAELFHGPTLAFKDFVAGFIARVLSYFTKDIEKDITILVATSGDTGNAVVNGFLIIHK